MRILFTVTFFVIFLNSLISQQTGKLKGIVVEKKSFLFLEWVRPIENAKIIAESLDYADSTRTDKDGYYYIIGLKAGEYKVNCQFDGLFSIGTKHTKIRGRLTSTVDFYMYPHKIELDSIMHMKETSRKKNE